MNKPDVIWQAFFFFPSNLFSVQQCLSRREGWSPSGKTGRWDGGQPPRGRAFPARCRCGSLPLSLSPLLAPSRQPETSPSLSAFAPSCSREAAAGRETHRLSPPGSRSLAGRTLPSAHRQRGAGGGGSRPGGRAALSAGHGAMLPADLGGWLGSVTPTSGSAD